MVNKLRWFALVGGGALATLAAWAGVRYGEGVALDHFGPYVALGLGTVALPTLAARGKAAVRRLRRRLQARGGHPSAGTVFVSNAPVEARRETLSMLAAATRERAAFRNVETVSFPEGDGLRLSHTGFHDSLVRFSDNDELVVSGASTKTNRLVARCAETACSVSLTQSSSNPLWQTQPVRGAPRMMLVLVVLVAVTTGPLGVATAAYHSDAYNPVEKAVLVSIDARSDVDPGTSLTDARLQKAAFMVQVLAEKRVEIRWERDDTAAIRKHARDAGAISSDVRQELAAVRADSPTPGQLDHVGRIERRLVRTKRRVEATAREQLRAANRTDETATRSPANESAGRP